MKKFERGEPAVMVHQGPGMVHPTRTPCVVTSVGTRRITVRTDDGNLWQFSTRTLIEWGSHRDWWPTTLEKTT